MALTQDKTTSQAMRTQVQVALAEDIGDGDRTAALIDAKLHLTAGVKTREAAVLCGAAWFDETFRQLDPRVVVTWNYSDGDALEAGAELCRLTGPARALLTGERTALNFLQLLCAVATATRDYVAAVAGTGARILDTRKTLPGLRLAQKYAVLCGGGHNHRKGLYDAILIKENHIHAAGSITQALARANLSAETSAPIGANSPPKIWIEVEVENLSQVEEALSVGAKLLLLDNFSQEQMRQAVALAKGRAQLEASGGVDLTTVRAIAETGVDFISVGALTKNIRAIDLSMRYQG